MLMLILGVILWSLAHWFKRFAPDRRAGLGDAGKGLVAIGVLAGLVLMVLGYRAADFIPVWQPPAFMMHLNNLLMLIAFYVYGLHMAKGTLAPRLRHPQLTAVKIWAVAHLLVNGDLASIILFGGLLAWAVVSVILINRAQPDWTPVAPERGLRGDVVNLVITLVLFAIVTGIHTWLGVWPYPA